MHQWTDAALGSGRQEDWRRPERRFMAGVKKGHEVGVREVDAEERVKM